MDLNKAICDIPRAFGNKLGILLKSTRFYVSSYTLGQTAEQDWNYFCDG